VGAAMRRKTKDELWDDALKELQRLVPSIEGIEAEVYKPLKWSNDSLEGISSSFVYFIVQILSHESNRVHTITSFKILNDMATVHS
jgi:hypothetical protein